MNRMPMTEGNYAASIEVPPRKTQTRRPISRKILNRWAVEEGTPMEAYARYKVGEVVALTLPHWRAKSGIQDVFIWDAITKMQRIWRPPTAGRKYLGPVDTVRIPDLRPGEDKRWRRMAARFMPLWAVLHWIEILTVRAERLQDADDWFSDAQAEGCLLVRHIDEGHHFEVLGHQWDVGCEAMAFLWDSIHGAGAWDRNDMVFVYTYKQVEKPDAL